jgi:hypothetical protein
VSGLELLEHAEAQLSQLHNELETNERTATQLEGAVQHEELARVRRAGGAVFFNAGTLRTQQQVSQRVDVLKREVVQQETRIGEYRKIVAVEEVDNLRKKRDQVFQHVRESFGQLTTLIQQLNHLRDVAASLDVDTAEFEPSQLFNGAADDDVYKLPLTQEFDRAAREFVATIAQSSELKNPTYRAKAA